MTGIIDMRKRRDAKKKPSGSVDRAGFTPCSQDMTICGDCEGNRAKNKCPRLREWLAEQKP